MESLLLLTSLHDFITHNKKALILHHISLSYQWQHAAHVIKQHTTDFVLWQFMAVYTMKCSFLLKRGSQPQQECRTACVLLGTQSLHKERRIYIVFTPFPCSKKQVLIHVTNLLVSSHTPKPALNSCSFFNGTPAHFFQWVKYQEPVFENDRRQKLFSSNF